MVASIEGMVKINERVNDYIEQLVAEIYFSPHHEKPKTLALASAEANEGRSSLALALSIQIRSTLSESVLMVEANLRSPGIVKLIGLPDDQIGLASVLEGEEDINSAIKSAGKGLPDVLPAGKCDKSIVSNLMSREKLGWLISELTNRYEYLIVETSPVNYFPEGQIIAGLSDGVVMAIKSGVTSRESVALAVKKIEAAGGHLLGVVLNRKQFYLPGWLYKRL